MTNAYPHVMSESDTLDQVLAGQSLARYGDGELKMIDGASIKSQQAHPILRKRLGQILENSGDCLVGIPNIHAVLRTHVSDQKVQFWSRFLAANRLLADRSYVSAFVTRPDSAPWIDTSEYWAKVESLWKGRSVTLVRGSTKSLVAEDLVGARVVHEVICPRQHAFAEYDQILERIGRAERVILCLGPTATVMAVDLCLKGIHAVDLGHLGMFRRKHLRGEPMWVTKADKVAAVA